MFASTGMDNPAWRDALRGFVEDEDDPIFLLEGFAQAQPQAAGKIRQTLRLVIQNTAKEE